jgi:hypothetical protein
LFIGVVAFFIVLFRFYGDVPAEYYHDLASGDPASPAPEIKTNNDSPQPGYFKAQPEWNFKVPPSAKGWEGYAKKPKNRDVIVLTASDGGGHNSAIPNVLERVLDDRQKYCDKHGYTNLWLNTSRYDIGDAHRVSSHIFLTSFLQGRQLLTRADMVQDPRCRRSLPPPPERRMGLAN